MISKRLEHLRGWIQAAATLLTNIHLPNFFKGKIYQGNAKTVCVPGLNCYSCPAATGACPIGAFQAVVGSSRFKFSYYITGFFILFGVILGRFICGFLCPFGWFQDPRNWSVISRRSTSIVPIITSTIPVWTGRMPGTMICASTAPSSASNAAYRRLCLILM